MTALYIPFFVAAYQKPRMKEPFREAVLYSAMMMKTQNKHVH